uniref:Glycosyltransferase 2-like domain-containing protein n=1 Tax=Zooxanthella nutricula TaxID=1333877 RepID=A0A6U9HIW4_9DINO|mmetsp:Transcript_100860/g.308367  ORF Transcript_100860/g.308367 Transcript_100860/m.308367 type:complete len:409 (+) Transcript_100860:84-1310(+)
MAVLSTPAPPGAEDVKGPPRAAQETYAVGVADPLLLEKGRHPVGDVFSGTQRCYQAWAKVLCVLSLAIVIAGALNAYVNAYLRVMQGAAFVVIICAVLSTSDSTKDDPLRPTGGRHVLLMSHYKEDRGMFDRLLNSVYDAQKNAKWEVTVVIAAEEGSLMITESWDQTALSPDPQSLPVHVAVHPKNQPGERAGLGSNLRHAINFIMTETSLPVSGTMVTKVDGNCWIPPHFFSQLESAWSSMDDNVCFQTSLIELDPRFGEYQECHLFLKPFARFASVLHIMATHVFYLCGFHSSFCMPLQMICRAGSWDPWMIQEDNLMLYRAALSSEGRLRCHLLRASVYNAPCLTWDDVIKQRMRCLTHGWLALGFVFGNIHRLMRAPLTMVMLAHSAFMRMFGSVLLGFFPLT